MTQFMHGVGLPFVCAPAEFLPHSFRGSEMSAGIKPAAQKLATGQRCRLAGKHCESGDVLIDRVLLPAPRRGDLLAVPATGAYTLAMASNYNGVPRPAAVLVRNGNARLIRRRETVDELLAHEQD